MKKCDCCKREFKKLSVHASALGPYTFGYCKECDKNLCQPVDVLEGIVRVHKCIHATRADFIRESHTVYVEGKYINMGMYLHNNRERYFSEYGIDRNFPTSVSRLLHKLEQAKKKQ